MSIRYRPLQGPPGAAPGLIFDSTYDSYKGVIIFCRIMEGTVKKRHPHPHDATGAEEDVVEVGYLGRTVHTM